MTLVGNQMLLSSEAAEEAVLPAFLTAMATVCSGSAHSTDWQAYGDHHHMENRLQLTRLDICQVKYQPSHAAAPAQMTLDSLWNMLLTSNKIITWSQPLCRAVTVTDCAQLTRGSSSQVVSYSFNMTAIYMLVLYAQYVPVSVGPLLAWCRSHTPFS